LFRQVDLHSERFTTGDVTAVVEIGGPAHSKSQFQKNQQRSSGEPAWQEVRTMNTSSRVQVDLHGKDFTPGSLTVQVDLRGKKFILRTNDSRVQLLSAAWNPDRLAELRWTRAARNNTEESGCF
jgi:hypothetical protein